MKGPVPTPVLIKSPAAVAVLVADTAATVNRNLSPRADVVGEASPRWSATSISQSHPAIAGDNTPLEKMAGSGCEQREPRWRMIRPCSLCCALLPRLVETCGERERKRGPGLRLNICPDVTDFGYREPACGAGEFDRTKCLGGTRRNSMSCQWVVVLPPGE